MRILVFFLLLNSTAIAQRLNFAADSAFISLVNLPAKEPFDTARPYIKVQAPYIYILSDKDLYDHFGYNMSMRFHEFDFSTFHILGSKGCRQCFLHCRHDSGRTECHRNACRVEWVWVKRINTKAFHEIPSINIPWNERKDARFYRDTIIQGDTSTWYTTGRGDCFARFEYAIVADRFFPVLLLRELNYYGGCRAGGSKPARISFIEPAGILFKTKRTVLVPKAGH